MCKLGFVGFGPPCQWKGRNNWAFLLAWPDVGQEGKWNGVYSQQPDDGVKWSYILKYPEEFTKNPLELINDLAMLQGTKSIYKKISCISIHLQWKIRNKVKKNTDQCLPSQLADLHKKSHPAEPSINSSCPTDVWAVVNC